MEEIQFANMIYGMIGKATERSKDYPEVGWRGFSSSDRNGSPGVEVQIKDGNGPGDHQVFEISVKEKGVENAEEPTSNGKIWELRDRLYARAGFPLEATVRSKFRDDDDERYVVYAEPGTQRMRVHTAAEFSHRYQLKPKYVTGGLYWSKSENGFCLYQGGDKAVVKFLAAKTDAGTGAATTSGMMPKDVVLVRYCEGREFTLTHRIQDHPAS
jgi:hypothetical protein